jgi:serine/threonine protein kinase
MEKKAVATLKEISTLLNQPKSLLKRRRVSIDKITSQKCFDMADKPVSRSATGLTHDELRVTDFKQLHKIGEGSYSSVKLFQKEGMRYACKIFRKPMNSQILENVRNEIEMLRRLNHKNIVKLHYTFEDTNHLYIVLEYVEGKTLAGFLKKSPTEEQIKHITRQMLSALNCMHCNNIAHRDLKLDNIMIDETNGNRVVIIDFGFATACEKKLRMFCGTPSYMSPEIVKRGWYSGSKADIWALGIILYRMVTGVFPFRGVSELEVFGKICKSKYDESKLPAELSHMLRQILCKAETERYKCSQVSRYST